MVAAQGLQASISDFRVSDVGEDGHLIVDGGLNELVILLVHTLQWGMIIEFGQRFLGRSRRRLGLAGFDSLATARQEGQRAVP
jgi:hypothetical protein